MTTTTSHRTTVARTEKEPVIDTLIVTEQAFSNVPPQLMKVLPVDEFFTDGVDHRMVLVVVSPKLLRAAQDLIEWWGFEFWNLTDMIMDAKEELSDRLEITGTSVVVATERKCILVGVQGNPLYHEANFFLNSLVVNGYSSLSQLLNRDQTIELFTVAPLVADYYWTFMASRLPDMYDVEIPDRNILAESAVADALISIKQVYVTAEMNRWVIGDMVEAVIELLPNKSKTTIYSSIAEQLSTDGWKCTWDWIRVWHQVALYFPESARDHSIKWSKYRAQMVAETKARNQRDGRRKS